MIKILKSEKVTKNIIHAWTLETKAMLRDNRLETYLDDEYLVDGAYVRKIRILERYPISEEVKNAWDIVMVNGETVFLLQM